MKIALVICQTRKLVVEYRAARDRASSRSRVVMTSCDAATLDSNLLQQSLRQQQQQQQQQYDSEYEWSPVHTGVEVEVDKKSKLSVLNSNSTFLSKVREY